MIYKFTKSILSVLMFFMACHIYGQFSFEYSGPDTLFLDESCEVVLDWGHPDNPTVVSTIGNTITSFNIESISGSYTLGGVINEEASVAITYKAIDNELNSDFFTFTIVVLDTIKPVIVTQASNKSFTCETAEATIMQELHNWFNNQAGMVATDNCGVVQYSADKTLTETETAFNQSINDNCGNTRSVTVLFSTADQYGNEADESFSATFFTFDNKAPQVIKNPSPLNISCNEMTDALLEAWIDDKGGAEVLDNCTENDKIQWSFVWNDNAGGSGFEKVGDKPYKLKNKKNCNYSGNINFIARDECGNQHAAFYTTFSIVKESEPDFSGLPQDTLIECSDTIPIPDITAYDACKGFLEVSFSEESNRSDDTLSCSFYNFDIIQSWSANDGCGIIINHSRTIMVRDTVAPDFDVPPDMTVNCTDLDDIEITGWPTNISDNCDQNPIIDYSDQKTGSGCQYTILRSWQLTDICGNLREKEQELTIIDTIYPEVVKELSDISVRCDSAVSFWQSFDNWVSNRAYGEVIDECSIVFSFAAKPGSYTAGQPATYPGTPVEFDMTDTLACSTDTFLYYQDVDFVFYDRCFNTLSFTRRFSVIDTVPPVIQFCPPDTSYILGAGACEKLVELIMPEAADNCTGNDHEITVKVKEQIKSNEPGDYYIPVNPVTLNIGPFNDINKTPAEILDLSLVFTKLDADDPSEFFYIVNEDGDTIDITPNTTEQCGDFEMQLKDLFTLEEIQGWMADGYLTISLMPNIPDFGGIFAINDICGGSNVTASFTYRRENPNKLAYYVKINDGEFKYLGSEAKTDTILSVGTHLITYLIQDCAGNESRCQNNIIIQDMEPPEIFCPGDMSVVMPNDSCNAEVLLPLDFLVYDNCSNNFHRASKVPKDTTKEFITFSYSNTLEEYVANSMVFVFDSFDTELLMLNAILKIQLTGDIADEDSYFEILDEQGNIIGTTSKANPYTTPGNCFEASLTTLDIDVHELNIWLENEQISFTVRPALTSNPVNPCTPVDSDGSTDSLSRISLTLEYDLVDVVFSVSGATVMDEKKLNHTSASGNIFAAGTSVVEYIVDDGSGNKASCTLNVEVTDIQPPEAHCKDVYVFFVNPNGIEITVLNPEEINTVSFDNCEIDSMAVIPNSFDCSFDNTSNKVQLIVWDNAGNSDTCTTDVVIRVESLQPSYAAGVCKDDSLKLFANLPQAPPNIWIIEWTGPNGFMSNEENPVRPNADATYSGTYVLTATGLNACVSSGTLQVGIEDLSRPEIVPASPSICLGEEILLETTSYSGTVKYHWYSGIYPNGVIIDSTTTPLLAHSPGLGKHSYYVIAKSENCQSLASLSATIDVFPFPVATIKDPFISLCEGETFAPQAASNGGLSYKWWGPAGYHSTDPNPGALYDVSAINQGTYYLEVSNVVCKDTARLELVVLPKPSRPRVETDTIYCRNRPMILTIPNVPDADNFSWYLNGNLYLSTISNSLLINEAVPQFQGKWEAVARKGNCYSDTSLAVFISIEDEYLVNAENNGPVCEGDTIILSAPSISNASYSWTGPDNFSSDQQNPLVLTDKSGQYLLSVTTEAGCRYFAATDVEVKIKPRITALSSSAPECLSGSDCVSFYPTVFPFQGQYAYNWNGPDGFSSTNENPQICDFSEAENGIYLLVVSDGFCSSDSTSIKINSKMKPSIPVLNAENQVCEGDSFRINIVNGQYQGGTIFHWSISPGGEQVITDKTYFVNYNAKVENTGIYNVYAETEGCISALSDNIYISVVKRPNQPFISGTAEICEGQTIELKTGYVDNGEYSWSGPAGFSSGSQNPKIFPGTVSNSGVYTLTVAIGKCVSETSEGFAVEVIELPQTPEIVPIDTAYCVKKGESEITLCLEKTEALTLYSWYTNTIPAKLIGESTLSCIDISDFSSFSDGLNSIFAVAARGACKSGYSDVENFVLSITPGRSANAGEDIFACDPDEAVLSAIPDPGGFWTAVDPTAFIANPDKSKTSVFDLEYGNNEFIWSLSHGVCQDFSRDTVIVYLEYVPEAFDDEYFTQYNTAITFDPSENDLNTPDSELSVTLGPGTRGEVIINNNGTVTYIPAPGFIGQAVLYYVITKTECRKNYDTGTIIVNVGDNTDCFGVNVITPNGDGINDALVFPCLESNIYTENELFVFNLWGDEVHRQFNYKNDWQGTYNSKDLPVGTYFYVLFLDVSRKNAINGFFVIER